MTFGDDDRLLGTAVGLLLPFLVGAALVAVRGHVEPSVIALVLACTVVVGARLGGRVGGVGAALVAAATFDFFHTVPYQSLKIDQADDIWITLILLVVGLFVGSIAGASTRNRNLIQRRYRATSAVTRVLTVAHSGPTEDVQLAVVAELMELLDLRSCSFTTDPVSLPALEKDGSWTPGSEVALDGFTLPESGVAIPVEARGHRFGSLICEPAHRHGIPAANRRSAYALADVLGLALSATAAA